MNLATLLERAGRGFAARPALALGETVVCDYRALARRVAVLAGNLRARHGLAPGDRVALAMKNSPEYVELLFACWHAGLAAVPVNAKLAAPEFRYIFEHSGARVCFVSPDLAAAVGGLPGPEAVMEIGGGDWKRLGEGDGIAIERIGIDRAHDQSRESARHVKTGADSSGPEETAPDDLAWLFYTSGTTGRPKGAMLTHRNLFAMIRGYFADVDAIAPTDAILHAAPMSHGSGLYILPHIAAGACNAIPESGGFEPEEMFRLFAAHPGSTVFAAPTMVRRLVAAAQDNAPDLTGLKTVVYGGGPMYLEDCKRAIACLGDRLAQIYGQGESPMTVTSLARSRFPKPGEPRYEERLASAGTPFAIVELRVADADDNPLPDGETGEILLRGDTVMPGYWRDEAASAATLRGGWLHTGDLGSLDADGYLALRDRSKDVIISGGANVYPREVEEVLLAHRCVREAAVVGRADAEWGEAVVAFVVAEPDCEIGTGELDRLCLDRIARFKRPKEYRFIDSLPKNNTGKVLKTELRQLVSDDS